MERIRSWALGVDSYVEYLSRVIEGEYAVSTPDLTYYLYLPGRSGGQSAFGGTAASDYLLLGSTAHATKGRVILGTAGANSVTFHEASNITNFGISQTGFSTGGRIGLSSASGRYLDFFSNAAGTSFDGEILTTGGEFAFRSLLSGGMGLLSEDLSDSTVTHGIELRGRSLLTLKTGEDAVVQRIRGGTSQTADLSEWQNFAGTSILLGINASGDLYGGTLGSSTLLLTSNNLAASSTSRLSLLSTSTDITFDNAAAGGYIPFRFGLGLASGTLTGLSAAINVTSTGGNPGTISVSNVGGSNASVLYKAIRIATQTGDMFECLDSNGSTLLSAFNSAGAYRLVSGGAVGSVLTSNANGVGSWSTIAALTASFSDALFSLFNAADQTKTIRFDATSMQTGSICIISAPDYGGGTVPLTVGQGTSGTFLQSQGDGFNPGWATALTPVGSLTANRVAIAGSASTIQDDSDLTFLTDTLTTKGLVIGTVGLTKYLGVTTVAAGVGSIVATSNLTAQAAAIAATTIYAVPAAGAGMYRVSWDATVTTAATVSSSLGGTNGFQLKFTDADDSVVKTSNPTTPTVSAGNTTATAISGVYCARCKASTNLQYLFDYASAGATAMLFNLHLRAEFLG